MAASNPVAVRGLYASLIDRGFTLSQDDAVLVVEPPHLLTSADIAEIRAHKPELIAIVTSPADHRGDPPMYRCPVMGCGQPIPWGISQPHVCGEWRRTQAGRIAA